MLAILCELLLPTLQAVLLIVLFSTGGCLIAPEAGFGLAAHFHRVDVDEPPAQQTRKLSSDCFT